MAYTRRHGLNVGPRYKNFQLGGSLRRRSDQFVWRHAERHRHFPKSWQVGRQAASGESAPDWPEDRPQKPSIGYWDGVRLFLGYEGRVLNVELLGPNWTWKQLTLPWPDYIIRAWFAFKRWTVTGYAQHGGPAEDAGWIQISRALWGSPVQILVRGGRAATPGWKRRRADFLSVGVEVEN